MGMKGKLQKVNLMIKNNKICHVFSVGLTQEVSCRTRQAELV